MTISDIRICSNALVMLGAEPITSFNDGGPGVSAGQLYPSCVQDLLSRYRWRFASGEVQLSKLLVAPRTRWRAAYQLPPGLLNVHQVTAGSATNLGQGDGDTIAYDTYLDTIVCNVDDDATAVFADCTFLVGEDLFRPYFTAFLEHEMAARLAVPVTAKVDLAAMMEAKALRHFMLAKSLDAQSQTPRQIPHGRFVAARMGGRR